MQWKRNWLAAEFDRDRVVGGFPGWLGPPKGNDRQDSSRYWVWAANLEPRLFECEGRGIAYQFGVQRGNLAERFLLLCRPCRDFQGTREFSSWAARVVDRVVLFFCLTADLTNSHFSFDTFFLMAMKRKV